LGQPRLELVAERRVVEQPLGTGLGVAATRTTGQVLVEVVDVGKTARVLAAEASRDQRAATRDIRDLAGCRWRGRRLSRSLGRRGSRGRWRLAGGCRWSGC